MTRVGKDGGGQGQGAWGKGVARSATSLLLVVGCGASQPAAKKPAPGQCGKVADHLISQMSGAAKAEPEDVDPYRKTLTTRCNDDHWSVELQNCLLASVKLDDNKRCDPLWTEEQNGNLAKSAPK